MPHLKALSIQQPWANLIVSYGKDIENRTWGTKYRGPILIHTGKQHDRDFSPNGLPAAAHAMGNPINYPKGGIVGYAEIIDCVEASDSPWFFGPYGFVLANMRRLPFHECKGMLGLFDVDYPSNLFLAHLSEQYPCKCKDRHIGHRLECQVGGAVRDALRDLETETIDQTMKRLTEDLQYQPPTHYTHCNSGNAIFVKEADFFKRQGGLQKEWGRAWVPIRADSLEDARKKALLIFPQGRNAP